MQQRQDRRQGVFGKELLPTHADNEKAQAIAKRRKQATYRLVGDHPMKLSLHNERQPHRQAGGKTREYDGPPASFEFLLSLRTDGFMDERCAWPALRPNFLRLPARDAVKLRGWIEGGTFGRLAHSRFSIELIKIKPAGAHLFLGPSTSRRSTCSTTFAWVRN